MRVLHITPAYTPAFKFGGPIQSIHALNRALVRKGVEVHTLTTTAGLEDRADLAQAEWTDVDGVLVKYCRYYGYVHFTFSPSMVRELLANPHQYDLLHVSAVWNFPVLAGSLFGKIRHTPYIISPRGAIYEETMKIKSKLKKQLYYSFIARHCINWASAIHFTTKDEREKVMASLGLKKRAIVIPNGIDLSVYEDLPFKGAFREKYPVLKNKRYILFLGRLNFIKGLHLLVEAFKEVVCFDDSIFLVIVGPDNEGYSETLKKSLKAYNLLDRTLFTGMLTGNDKISAYVDADIFVLPSYSENFGMSIVEAMACGTPVVISENVGIHREVSANKAGIIVKMDSASLYMGMKRLLDDERLRLETAENGRKMAKTYYNIDKIADMMISAYKEILTETGKHAE